MDRRTFIRTVPVAVGATLLPIPTFADPPLTPTVDPLKDGPVTLTAPGDLVRLPSDWRSFLAAPNLVWFDEMRTRPASSWAINYDLHANGVSIHRRRMLVEMPPGTYAARTVRENFQLRVQLNSSVDCGETGWQLVHQESLFPLVLEPLGPAPLAGAALATC